jgi:N-acetyl-gamma-glutamyl-phosphate reductase
MTNPAVASSFSTDTASTDDGAPTDRVALLHGAGYVGRELIRLLSGHPGVTLATVTSRTYAGKPFHAAHPALRGQVDGAFDAPDALDAATLAGLDAVVVAAEHGRSMTVVPALRDAGFEGPVVDLSADFRLRNAALYPTWYDTTHAAPALLDAAAYGLPECCAPYPDGTTLVANPGCFATGLALALAPLAAQDTPLDVHATALTGASGSGARPSAATHFPDRDGNVRAYKTLAHQHVPEVRQTIGDHVDLHFVPASGPWTRGIWGTLQVRWPGDAPDEATVAAWYDDAYAAASCVRCTPGALPELGPVVGTPFCDLGWQQEGRTLVVGFALDNLLKGAASQAVQNLNRLLGHPEAAGLLPASPPVTA